MDYRALYPEGRDTKDRRRVNCWAHEDSNASLDINLATGVYTCRSCGESGGAAKYIREQKGENPKDYGIGKYVDERVVDRHHADLIANKDALAYLKTTRGVSLKTVKDWKIGYETETQRFTFPIRDDKGNVVNIRRYLPNSGKLEKTLSVAGRGELRLHPIELLRREQDIVLCAGETDWLVAVNAGLHAATSTGGEGQWPKQFIDEFKDKNVNIVYDIDDEGIKGAVAVATALFGTARTIRVLTLPLDKAKFPKGDLSDYFNKITPRPKAKDLLNLARATSVFTPAGSQVSVVDPLQDDEVYDVDFPSAVLAQYAGKRVRFSAHIAGKDKVPYIVPTQLAMTCGENAGTLCNRCKCAGKGGHVQITIDGADPKLLTMFRCSDTQLKGAIRDTFGIPLMCKVHQITTEKSSNIEEIHLIRSPGTDIELDVTNDEYVTRLGYYIYPAEASGLTWNSSYEFTTRTGPEPTRQYAISQVYQAAPKETDIEKFTLELARVTELRKIFSPKKWTLELISEKMKDVSRDISLNVSHIFGRDDLHTTVDLVYHSVIAFDWEGKIVRGWLDALLIGDTRQGKTETTQAYRKHYRLGDRVDCSRATVAGLIGGATELMKGHWRIEWGAIPLADRRLCILEEVKNLTTEQIGSIKEMRSSGVAEVTAIKRDRTHARTRLIWNSNPRSNRKLNTYNYGIDAVSELIGDPENIARFDLICCVADNAQEVDPNVLHQSRSQRDSVEHIYTSEACRDVVLFAWSRSPKQVVIPSESVLRIFDLARHIASKYDDEFPLVQAADFRYKLARIAIACAARTFSTDGENIIVHEGHVEWAAKFFEELACKPSFGYHLFSDDQQKYKNLADASEIASAITSVNYPEPLIASLLTARMFNRTQVAAWAGLDKDAATELCGLFQRNRAIQETYPGKYVKSAAFQTLLRGLQDMKIKHKEAD